MSERCLSRGRTGRVCGKCQPCQVVARLAAGIYLDSKVRTPIHELTGRLQKRTGLSYKECRNGIIAAAIRAGRGLKYVEKGSRDGFTLGEACARCGLRGEHVCITAPSLVGSSLEAGVSVWAP